MKDARLTGAMVWVQNKPIPKSPRDGALASTPSGGVSVDQDSSSDEELGFRPGWRKWEDMR